MPEKLIHTKNLTPGMKLSKPLHSNGANIILFPKDFVLDEASVAKAQAEGVGLVFIYSDPEPQEDATQPPAESAREKGKVLVVDDDRAIIDIIKTVLKKRGLETETATNAMEAWKLLKSDAAITAMFLDINMPEVSGLELLKIIRKQLGRDVKVIMVTAKKSREEVVTAIKLGAKDYVVKPFTPDRLTKVLEDNKL